MILSGKVLLFKVILMHSEIWKDTLEFDFRMSAIVILGSQLFLMVLLSFLNYCVFSLGQNRSALISNSVQYRNILRQHLSNITP